jgi:hypothetical protein
MEEEGENAIESFEYLMTDNCLRITDSVTITNVIFQGDIQTKIKKLMADGVQELNSKNLVNYYGDKLKEMLKWDITDSNTIFSFNVEYKQCNLALRHDSTVHRRVFISFGDRQHWPKSWGEVKDISMAFYVEYTNVFEAEYHSSCQKNRFWLSSNYIKRFN